ncbi:MAG: nicotinate mononucleotide-dependent phosphoribosyltransferase CobT [Cyanobacteria bacterium P01_A01_bin.45]
MIDIYTKIEQAQQWLQKYQGCQPIFACILGFTETALIPGISAAGKTPEDRKYTACADAEFLYYGTNHHPEYSLPPLIAGASPVFISRAIIEKFNIPVRIFNAGLPQPPNVPNINIGNPPAKCLSTGKAMELSTVKHLFEQGLLWGEKLGEELENSYLILSECVVGGTTTALAILTALGVDATGKVNSSHPVCNHAQKIQVVQTGLRQLASLAGTHSNIQHLDPLQIVAAVGDPMQVAAAGMIIAASRKCGVLLAGGTQMLAVYALTCAIAAFNREHSQMFPWKPQEVIIGTTGWVAKDPTGDTVELAKLQSTNSVLSNEIAPPLLATQLNFVNSTYPQLQAYEQGFVKEGVGAGGACISAHMISEIQQYQLLELIESQLEKYSSLNI